MNLLKSVRHQIEEYETQVRPPKLVVRLRCSNIMAGFRPNSEIIGKFRKLKKFYDNFVQREK